MSTHRVRFRGPVARAMDVATTLANAAGVELTSSEPPHPLDDGVVELAVTVEGSQRIIAAAVASIRDELPEGASIEITPPR